MPSSANGLVEKRLLSELLSRRETLRDWYWLWDFNHSVDENETLRAEGFKVFGGGRHANSMEHDRARCLEFVGQFGLHAPPSVRFDGPAEAVTFLEARPAVAYVYKPDEGDSYETFLPEADDPREANEELRAHLRANTHVGAFILQERKEGVETNAEVWFQASVLEKAAQVRFPYRHYRADGDQTNYPTSPLRRYEALKAMGYI